MEDQSQSSRPKRILGKVHLSKIAKRGGKSLRFIISGAIVNMTSYFATIGLVYAGSPVFVAVTVTYWCTVLATFLINRRFVFQWEGPILPAFIKYLVVYISGYVISLATLMILTKIMGLEKLIAITVTSVTMPIYFYLAQKNHVFYVKETLKKSHDYRT